MSRILEEHISRLIRISEQEREQVMQYFASRSFKKKQNLHEAGKTCRSNYFVEQGYLRLFFVNEKGTEQTIQFALENYTGSSHYSHNQKKRSTVNSLNNILNLFNGYLNTYWLPSWVLPQNI